MKCTSKFLLMSCGLLCLALVGCSFQWNEETRAVWVVRDALESPDSVARMVNDAASAGFNTLLVQVRGRGDSYYQSDFVPRAEDLATQPPQFDPLRLILEQARQRGLKVHAWINLLLVSSARTLPQSPAHVVNTHPDWLVTPSPLIARLAKLAPASPRQLSLRAEYFRKSQEGEGLFLDPALPEVQAHLLAVVEELISKYPLDGIHLDYVRYPGSDPGYGLGSMAGFVKVVSRDISVAEKRKLDQKYRRDPLIYARQFSSQWNDFRRAAVTALVRQIRDTIKRHNPAIKLSAAVVADADMALRDRLQDWKTWTTLGILDVVCPMSYTAEPDTFTLRVTAARDSRADSSLWAGIGAYKLDAPGLIRQIQISRTLGSDGFVIFSYNTLAQSRKGLLEPLGAFLKNSPGPRESRVIW